MPKSSSFTEGSLFLAGAAILLICAAYVGAFAHRLEMIEKRINALELKLEDAKIVTKEGTTPRGIHWRVTEEL